MNDATEGVHRSISLKEKSSPDLSRRSQMRGSLRNLQDISRAHDNIVAGVWPARYYLNIIPGEL